MIWFQSRERKTVNEERFTRGKVARLHIRRAESNLFQMWANCYFHYCFSFCLFFYFGAWKLSSSSFCVELLFFLLLSSQIRCSSWCSFFHCVSLTPLCCWSSSFFFSLSLRFFCVCEYGLSLNTYGEAVFGLFHIKMNFMECLCSNGYAMNGMFKMTSTQKKSHYWEIINMKWKSNCFTAPKIASHKISYNRQKKQKQTNKQQPMPDLWLWLLLSLLLLSLCSCGGFCCFSIGQSSLKPNSLLQLKSAIKFENLFGLSCKFWFALCICLPYVRMNYGFL